MSTIDLNRRGLFKAGAVIAAASTISSIPVVAQAAEEPEKKIRPLTGKNLKMKDVLDRANDEATHAEGKLKRKNLDFIVLNSLRDQGAGFRCDTNKITIIDNAGGVTSYPLKTKREVACDIVNKLVTLLK